LRAQNLNLPEQVGWRRSLNGVLIVNQATLWDPYFGQDISFRSVPAE